LPVAADYQTINVAVERHDPTSMLTLYRRLIALRRATLALAVGSYVGLEADGDVLAYRREYAGQRCLVVLNLGSEPQRFERRQMEGQGRIMLSTHLDRADEVVRETIALRGDEGVIVSLA
jgi:alpha-glucosidase